MAEVWLAENTIGKKAAVKLLLPKFCDDETVVTRFKNEGNVMVNLNHPNIRQIYDFGELDGRPAIIMEYLEGDDLKARMKRGQRFSDEQLKRWWNQLVDALNYTHSQGIIHRDIKPSNIFADTKGNIKLLDFGIAKVRESISVTQTGQTLGTLMYMSPEQVKDSKHIDYRTDLYSLAVSFVHLLTGKPPYDTNTHSDYDIQERIVTKPLDLQGIPAEWQAFLLPYLSKEADQRPELRYFEAHHETAVTPQTTPKPKKRRLGLLALLAVAAAVLLFLFLRPKDKAEPTPSNQDIEAYFNCSTVNDYRAFMRNYGPTATYYNEAKSLVDYYVADSIEKVQQALDQQNVEERRKSYEANKKKEDALFAKCNTIEGCANYLNTFPQGRYAEEVAKRKQELEEEKSQIAKNEAQAKAEAQQELTPVLTSGTFTVGTNRKVRFAHGNLQYKPSTGKWRFALHQYDHVGTPNRFVSDTYNGWVDLFGYGTGKNPTAHSTSFGEYRMFWDWGYNPVINGGTQKWRTLGKDEWSYLLETRKTSSGVLFVMARVAGVNGLLLLPDDWNSATFKLNKTNDASAAFESNTITASQWSSLENAGVVFLPVCGSRTGSEVDDDGDHGHYWTSSYIPNNNYGGFQIRINREGLDYRSACNSYFGLSVRLATDVEN